MSDARVRARVRHVTSIAVGTALLFALSTIPADAVLVGILVGAVEGNAVRGFMAALAAGMIYAVAITVAMAGAGPVTLAFEFYYAYVMDTVLCTVGGLLGGWTFRTLRRRVTSRGAQ
ncbi:MAG: hypothetical protein ACP5G6_03070 [Conexivisphaera sp.]|nr:MAG: hypothetical protein C0167_04460 [Nitrososphaera sp.]